MEEKYLAHHGVKGQVHGVRNGPPYPLYRQERFRHRGPKFKGERSKNLVEKAIKRATNDTSKSEKGKSIVGRLINNPLVGKYRLSRNERSASINRGAIRDAKLAQESWQRDLDRVNSKRSKDSKYKTYKDYTDATGNSKLQRQYENAMRSTNKTIEYNTRQLNKYKSKSDKIKSDLDRYGYEVKSTSAYRDPNKYGAVERKWINTTDVTGGVVVGDTYKVRRKKKRQ